MRTSLQVFLIATVMVSSTAAAQTAGRQDAVGSTTGALIAHLPLDGSIVDKVSGVTPTVLIGTGPTEGKLDGAIQFDGSSFVQLPIDISPQALPELTITMWVKPDRLPDDPELRKAFYPNAYLLSDGDGLLTIGNQQKDIPSYSAYSTGAVISNSNHPGMRGGWQLLAITRKIEDRTTDDGDVWPHTVLTLYSNGRVTETAGIRKEKAITPYLSLGASSKGSSGKYRGAVDDVRVYAKALSPEEIRRVATGQPASAGRIGNGFDGNSEVADRLGNFNEDRLGNFDEDRLGNFDEDRLGNFEPPNVGAADAGIDAAEIQDLMNGNAGDVAEIQDLMNGQPVMSAGSHPLSDGSSTGGAPTVSPDVASGRDAGSAGGGNAGAITTYGGPVEASIDATSVQPGEPIQDQRAQTDSIARPDLAPVTEAPATGQIETAERIEEFEEATKPDDWSITIDYPGHGFVLANAKIELDYEISKSGDSFLGGVPSVQVFSADGRRLATDLNTPGQLETSAVDIRDDASGRLTFEPPELAFGQEGPRDIHFMVALYDRTSGERLVDANAENNFVSTRLHVVQVDWRIKELRLLRSAEELIYAGDTLQFEAVIEKNDPRDVVPEVKVEASLGGVGQSTITTVDRIRLETHDGTPVARKTISFDYTVPTDIQFADDRLQYDVNLELRLQHPYVFQKSIGDANRDNDRTAVSFRVTRPEVFAGAGNNQTISIDTSNLIKVELPSVSQYSHERIEIIGSGSLPDLLSLRGVCNFWLRDSSGKSEVEVLDGCDSGDAPTTVRVEIPDDRAIVGMKVCRKSGQIHGIEVQVASVRPDASLESALTTIQGTRHGYACDDWTQYANCPTGQAAGGVDLVHFRGYQDDPFTHSLNLLCGPIQVSQGT